MKPVRIAESFAPLATVQAIALHEANECLVAWQHRMGPVTRPPEYGLWCHALVVNGSAIAVSVTATLIRAHVGGGLGHLTRADTIELARLCAHRPGLNRAMLRLWREVVFAEIPYANAISYQDSRLHSGDIYRFDGWARSPRQSRSGTDDRVGQVGRSKWIWVWPPSAVGEAAA